MIGTKSEFTLSYRKIPSSIWDDGVFWEACFNLLERAGIFKINAHTKSSHSSAFAYNMGCN